MTVDENARLTPRSRARESWSYSVGPRPTAVDKATPFFRRSQIRAVVRIGETGVVCFDDRSSRSTEASLCPADTLHCGMGWGVARQVSD